MAQVEAEMKDLVPGRLVHLLFLGVEPLENGSHPQGWYRFERWDYMLLEEFGGEWAWYAHFKAAGGGKVMLDVDMVLGKKDARNLWHDLDRSRPLETHLAGLHDRD